jgi:5-methylcytosine-specific restriction endonuclease McrA
MGKRKTTEEFIVDAYCKHGDRYNYKLVEYKNNKTKVKIVCHEHGIFEQSPNHHLSGKNCPKCGILTTKRKQQYTTKQFVEKAKAVHGDKYDYSLVEYKNSGTKVKIICPIHGVFEQSPYTHSIGHGCPKCRQPSFIPVKYDVYQQQLEPYGVECRRNEEDQNILEVKCMYCDRLYKPSKQLIKNKIKTINGQRSGESNLYCSDECKRVCPTYHRYKYPKDFKINTSREVQPELRKLVLKRDNYTCQKCNTTNTELHCHHYEGIEVNPVESADIDQCITLCKQCHNNIHKKDKCGIKDYKRGKCK